MHALVLLKDRPRFTRHEIYLHVLIRPPALYLWSILENTKISKLESVYSSR